MNQKKYKFKKLVIIEPVNLLPYTFEEINKYAESIIIYDNIPQSDEEIISRINDADAIFVSYTTQISNLAINSSQKLKYIGMCCSLYSEQSANVDIQAAHNKGVIVKGVRDYGDEGVAEFVVSELVQLLHGFNGRMWDNEPREISDLKVGIIGLGVTGSIIAKALNFFGSDLYYYSRTRKKEAEKNGIKYLDLNSLLRECEVICCCLTKNIVILNQEEFNILGERKILINTGGGIPYDMSCLGQFLEKDNYFICDIPSTVPDISLHRHKNIRLIGSPSGLTKQARHRLSEKVLLNIQIALDELNQNS